VADRYDFVGLYEKQGENCPLLRPTERKRCARTGHPKGAEHPVLEIWPLIACRRGHLVPAPLPSVPRPYREYGENAVPRRFRVDAKKASIGPWCTNWHLIQRRRCAAGRIGTRQTGSLPPSAVRRPPLVACVALYGRHVEVMAMNSLWALPLFRHPWRGLLVCAVVISEAAVTQTDSAKSTTPAAHHRAAGAG